jgi:AcrR family transcriptional regulator
VLPATHSGQSTSSLEGGRLRTRKKANTRVAIEDAALDLFAKHGFEETTVDQIAERAGVSKATYFRYFPSKGAVIFGRDPGRHAGLQQAIIDRPKTEDSLRAVCAAVRQQWLPTLDPERTARQTRAARTSPILRGLSHDLSMQWQQDVSEALARRRRLERPDRGCHLAAGVAFVVLSNAVNLWMDNDCVGDLGAHIDEGLELLDATLGQGRKGNIQ